MGLLLEKFMLLSKTIKARELNMLHPYEMHPTQGKIGWEQAAPCACPVLTPFHAARQLPGQNLGLQELSVPPGVAHEPGRGSQPCHAGGSGEQEPSPQPGSAPMSRWMQFLFFGPDLWVVSSLMSHFLFP